jgi:hypothetical protein
VLVIHHEAEADDAGGAHLAVPTRTVGYPLQRIRAHRAAVVHLGQAAAAEGKSKVRARAAAGRKWGEKVGVGEPVRFLFYLFFSRPSLCGLRFRERATLPKFVEIWRIRSGMNLKIVEFIFYKLLFF